ncbi:MAG TPA: UDP-N-acetylglucosamine 2-epimerase (non-hydrolyzing) [Vicinamibacterales bacterium]|nr:UDP-N-acetylglucosamine 2-epimerase (non-hydrolyzing) [Vicinamibacterales bacterium]
MIHVVHIVGARPNFMKAAAVHRALAGTVKQTLIHTGQHYDRMMSDIFFQQLDLPAPDTSLGVGSATHAVQTGEVMIRLEPLLIDLRPDLVLVYGDVNSTIAAALVATKLGIRVGHVEAGLRSRDRTMPEEINRIATDAVADLLFTPSSDGSENLTAEGVPADRVFLVGNVMIDTLVRLLPHADTSRTRSTLGLAGPFALVTLHRPSNVDDSRVLSSLVEGLLKVAHRLRVIFPVHPRTRARMPSLGAGNNGLMMVDPLGYLEFLSLEREASVVITDSGGVQEETTFLGVPCLTMRSNTERPITVTEGTNMLLGQDVSRLVDEVDRILSGNWKVGSVPALWDGQAGRRIAEVISRR